MPPRAHAPFTMNCRNCGSALDGRYCSDCGQEARDLDLSLKEILGELMGNLLSFDSRVWRTVRLLLFRPGELTARYLEGQRVRFVPPVRLYVFVSIVHFLLLAWIGPSEQVVVGVQAAPGGATAQEILQDIDVPAPFREVLVDPERFWRDFLQGMSYLMFFLVPVFGGLLKLAYGVRRRPYLHHLVFAVHFHAMVFVVLTARVLLEASGQRILESLADLISLAIPVYLFMALRRVYGGRRWTTLLRTGTVGVSYSLVLALSLVLLASFLVFVWRS